jgi:NAD(P)H-flavin reductase
VSRAHTEWVQTHVTRAWAASETLRGLAVDATAGGLGTHHERPGQYVRVRLDGGERPFALASEPGAPELELLFKPENAMTERMAELAPGAALTVGAPQGRGFPLREHQDQDLILVGAGTGIAPLRAVVRAILPERARYGQVLLFYGQRSPGHFAFTEEYAAWGAAGVEIHLCASEAGARVQDAVRARAPVTASACAYLCGMKAMVNEVAHLLREMGLPADRVFLNA